MKIFYDFHIHSALSPCADDESTPCNIVNMAVLNGLNAIALTDHNSVKNCRAAINAAKDRNLLVIPGMELTTNEDIHILCLFDDIKKAEDFEDYIKRDMIKIKNKVNVFGHQYIYNENDSISGEEEMLLSVATGVPSYKAADIVKSYGGVAIPAHINRESNGIISILGDIDKSMGFNTVEITDKDGGKDGLNLSDFKIICDSDAHNLNNISEAVNFIEIPKVTAKDIIKYLKKI